MQSRGFWLSLLVLSVLGCGGDDAPPDDDAGTSDAANACTDDTACDDGLFCNGAETCAPSDPRADADGCLASAPPCGATDTCDEAADRCDACRTDADGDGAIAIACGGDDCDDDDPDRFPDNAEVCDPEGVDEDCDPTTVGSTDADDDGAISSACCNGDTCGNDCDDARANVNASATEACDGFDNDCDGSVDEGVLRTFYADTDGDGYGDADGDTRTSCAPPEGFVEDATDCDDTARTVNPVAAERCANEVDDDCDGDTDESGVVRYYRDADDDTYGALGDFVDSASCEPPTGYVAIAGDCNDTSAAYYPGAPDPCDGRDTSCNLPATPGAADPAEDADGDRHTAIDASCVLGDVGFGSYPKDDCDDTDPNVHPGATERCNRRDDVCASGGGVRASEDVDGDGHSAPGASCMGGFPKDDCVDTNATIYPGAPERCDRLDNVCASGGGVRASEDVDDDGHAPPSASCEGGFPKDDCVDTNAAIHPGAPELCDRIDNVCASGGGVRASEDADLDGFAAIAASCTGGPLPKTDCDDTRASVFPGARETCGGGDEDCDTVLDASDADAARWCGPHASCAGGTTCALDATLAAGGLDGRGFSLAVRSGQALGWGSNESSRLGHPTLDDPANRSVVPLAIAPAARVFGGYHSGCLIDTAGALRCWGSHEPFGLPGTPLTTPTAIAIPNAIEVVATYAATCARSADQRLFCVGRGDSGELLGMGSGATPVELDLGLTDGFSQLAAGQTHFCALGRDRRVHCWGANDFGQLGRGGPGGGVMPAEGITDAVEVAAGGRHTCVRRSSGRVVCFGTGMRGELGDGTSTSSIVALEVSGITDAVQLALGREHSCARLATGAVRCWGRNDAAQLGDGTLTDRATPVAVSGLADAVFVAAADDHTCARRAGGAVVCWGRNDSGELGDGTDTLSVPFPVPVDDLSDAVELAAGSATRTCARRVGGQVVCWGATPLGDGTTDDSARPRTVASIADAAQLGGHLPATCIRRSGGQLACFGRDLLGGAAPSNSPITVAGLASASLVSHGPSARHACALTSDGLRCFGNNDAGELGNGTTDSATPLAPTFTLPSITQLAVATVSAFNRGRTCAVYDGGRVGCWGSNLGGVLGDGTETDRSTPVDATGLADVTQIALGDLHSCARSSTGAVRCWGLNFYGEVGDGTTTTRSAPTLVTMPSALDVSAHAGVSCATLASRGVRCWGRGENGRLGTSDYLPRTTPTAVTDLTTAVQVAAADAVCARLGTGAVVCWGPRAGLGNEDYAVSPRAPVSVAFP